MEKWSAVSSAQCGSQPRQPPPAAAAHTIDITRRSRNIDQFFGSGKAIPALHNTSLSFRIVASDRRQSSANSVTTHGCGDRRHTNVLEGIGQYGGTLITPAVGTAYTEITPLRGLVGTIQTANRGPGAPHLVVPFIHKGFEFSADQTVLTMYLRKGMKWSDGEPYTADDVMFWLED